MRKPGALLPLLLCAALLRAGCGAHAGAGEGQGLAAWASARPPPLPSLARDGVERLAWLPGVGVGRARRIVETRPFLGRPLEVELLPELPGVGETTAAEVDAWFEEQGMER